IFIDFLSFRPYRQGEYWLGHKQFCGHFLFPLLMQAFRGVSYNAWFRGSPEGINLSDILELIPFHNKFSP
ncbi:MAG TPA: hypothetical protein PLD88_15195, partial [Candidatus Berkiella sp.]|nr:hypothetical protein [Candidatus Berkiella sp.]